MIVVADDDDDVREIIVQTLRQQGHTVIGVMDGAAAFTQVNRHHPAVVVSDIDMPTMSGIDLCRAIRADPDLRSTPVVFVSGSLPPSGMSHGR
jgi:CheY-like chemotaxis protein